MDMQIIFVLFTEKLFYPLECTQNELLLLLIPDRLVQIDKNGILQKLA